MKVFTTIIKILAALAAIAGLVYVAATYGDKIVAWSKQLLARINNFCFCNCSEEVVEAECCEEEASETEEAPAEAAFAAEDVDFEG